MTPAISSSSSMGVLHVRVHRQVAALADRAPRKMVAPATAFILPSAFARLAGAPMRPMSAAWTWPHEFG